MKCIFKRGMLWLTLLLTLVIFISVQEFKTESVGINQTIGFNFQLEYAILIANSLIVISWFIFIIGYGILALKKIKTNFKLSIFHFILQIGTLISGHYENLYLCIGLTSILIFSINIFKSLKQRKKTNE